MDGENERELIGCPKVISYDCSKKIIEQMEKNICKITFANTSGTGFFCNIPFPDEYNMIHALITNNHVINKELLYQPNFTISISSKIFENKKLNLNDRIKYTNIEYDITIIEIKEDDHIGDIYLELDEDILKDITNSKNNNDKYIENTIYITQYPEGQLSVSYGILETILNEKKYYFYHKCSTKDGSSGSPIFNIKSNKVIGIHSKGMKNEKNNKGIFLNYPIKEFIELNTVDENKEEEEKALKEFNKTFKLDLKDNKIEKLDLNSHIGCDSYIEELTKIKLNNLKELSIGFSLFSKMEIFSKMKLDKLELLDLGYNSITDLNPLSKVKYNNLKKLNLYNNKIQNIKGLDTAKFPQLEMLTLGCNQISDISLLYRMNYKNLKKLDFQHNNITDITVFEKVKFELLENLDLSDNKISLIDGLDKANMKKLKVLDLSNNDISDVKQFGKISNLINLKTLCVKGPKITEEKFSEIFSYLTLKNNGIIC